MEIAAALPITMPVTGAVAWTRPPGRCGSGRALTGGSSGLAASLPAPSPTRRAKMRGRPACNKGGRGDQAPPRPLRLHVSRAAPRLGVGSEITGWDGTCGAREGSEELVPQRLLHPQGVLQVIGYDGALRFEHGLETVVARGRVELCVLRIESPPVQAVLVGAITSCALTTA